jgi:hypothetical protein
MASLRWVSRKDAKTQRRFSKKFQKASDCAKSCKKLQKVGGTF